MPVIFLLISVILDGSTPTLAPPVMPPGYGEPEMKGRAG